MSETRENDEGAAVGQGGGEGRGIGESEILEDVRSRYAGVLCPVHGVPPQFDVDEKGGVIEAFCCETLGQIFGELRGGEG
jgi:hypothetical protein